MAIITIPELGDGLLQFFEVAEDAAMDGLLLQRAVEALNHAIGPRLGDEGEALVDAPQHELLQEVVG